MTEYIWREISCQKAVNGSEFNRGVQDFNFQVGNPTGWIPSKSYFKIDMTLKGKGDKAPSVRQGIAFADNAPAALYNNIYFRAGGQDVSSVVNHVPQIAQVKTRLQKTLGWQQSIGTSTMLIEPDFNKRLRLTSASDGGQVDEKYTIASIGDGADFDTAEVSVVAATGLVTGTDTKFSKAKAGDKLVIAGSEYEILQIGTGANKDDRLFITTTIPTDIADTNDAYFKIYERTTSANTVSTIWQPPIGIFDHTEPLGSGDYRFQLNPNSDYKRAIVESLHNSTPVEESKLATDYTKYYVNVDRVRLYVCTVKVSIPSGVSTLHLLEAAAHTKTWADSLEFTVPASTRALTVFVQHKSAGSNPMFPPTRFIRGDNKERELQSIQLTYANCTKPATRWESNYTNNLNQLQQRYLETQLESNLIASQSGPETMEHWLQRGPIYHFTFAKDEMDKSTQVQLSTSFKGTDTDSEFNVFVVAWYSRATQITTSNGVVVDVASLNI